MTFDIESRIGFGVNQTLASSQHVSKRRAFSRISVRMKLLVPLMMPAIHSMRLAVRPSRSDLMIGIPPASSFECHRHALLLRGGEDFVTVFGGSFLLAVTTCLPDSMAFSTSSLAMPVPPISSTTMSMSGLLTTLNASLVDFNAIAGDFARTLGVQVGTIFSWIARPARRLISSALRLRTVAVPPPTVPMPNRPH